MNTETRNMDRPWNKQRERLNRRQGVINEIHFTHNRLARLLRAMAPREAHGSIGSLLAAEHAHDNHSLRAIITLALDLGMPPGPCVCAEGDALVEAIYHADRIPRVEPVRVRRILENLRDARRYIVGLWGRLAYELEEAIEDRELYRLVVRSQHAEAEQHRGLVRAIADMEGGGDSNDLKRTG